MQSSLEVWEMRPRHVSMILWFSHISSFSKCKIANARRTVPRDSIPTVSSDVPVALSLAKKSCQKVNVATQNLPLQGRGEDGASEKKPKNDGSIS